MISRRAGALYASCRGTVQILIFDFSWQGADHVAQWLGPFVQWAIARTARSAVLYCTICIVQNVLGGVGRDATWILRRRIAAGTRE